VTYTLSLDQAAERDLRGLPKRDGPRIAQKLRALAQNPRPVGSAKLSGTRADWRIRVGNYRIVYEISDENRHVRVHRVRHRKDVYR
jgi:mRNA interferase RelE/StbE